ncbi:MAG: hypothetical protein ACXWTY_13425 [Methylobacter sp.]
METNNFDLNSCMNSASESNRLDDFSSVIGGPLYQLFNRARIGTETFGLVKRRVIVISLFTWLPLLSIIARTRSPVCVCPRLAQAKRQGLLEYGVLASRYVQEFDQKWLRGEAPQDEPLAVEIFNH